MDVVYVFTHMFASVFHVYLQVFHTHVSDASAVSYACCKCFIWMFQLGCCAFYNVNHLLQPPTAAARASCMEGSSAASVKGSGAAGAATGVVGKRAGTARAGPASVCSKCWCGRCREAWGASRAGPASACSRRGSEREEYVRTSGR
jgi:hypothetical protein